jgi:hypothetical protein
MAEREQSYKKHARLLPLFHFFVIRCSSSMSSSPDGGSPDARLGTAWNLVFAIAVLGVGS